MAKIILTSKEDLHASMCKGLQHLKKYGDNQGLVNLLLPLSKTRHKKKVFQWFEMYSYCKIYEENGALRTTNRSEDRKLIDVELAQKNPFFQIASAKPQPKKEEPKKDLASNNSIDAKSTRSDIERKLKEFFKNPNEENISLLNNLMQSYSRRMKIVTNNQGDRAKFLQGGAPGLGKKS